MISKGEKGGPREPQAPKGTIRKVAHTQRGTEVTLRLKNDDSRAIHYISNVRTIRYDAATKRVTVGLSDEGRELVPGAAQVHPAFNYIDPASEAELHLVLPPRIVKLAEGGPPDGEVRFEEQDLADADEIVVEIAWSDTPFYRDSRESAATRDRRLPTERWMQGKSVMAGKMPARPGRPARSS